MKHLAADYEVLVIGGGHAGCEAAHAAHRLGRRVALVTLRSDTIGEMSCNPAVGGVGKGHIVREVDALGGLIGKVADQAGIHFRLLNRSRGPAVRGPRVQCDRGLFKSAMQAELRRGENIDIIEDEVERLEIRNGQVEGVFGLRSGLIRARCVIITTGTFLGGKLFCGQEIVAGGRVNERASTALSRQLRDKCFSIGRLKTGTPPRLAKSSIDWTSLTPQPSDEDPYFLSIMTDRFLCPQVSCRVTATNSETHDIVRAHLDQSAVYGGLIESAGPRYCPSIEDKIVRFSDKASHNIFLEPETLDGDWIYPNGISTSLPREVQEMFVRSIRGLEEAEILQYGYAVEYDFIQPTEVAGNLESQRVANLFFAGQILGTTGYEEAAGLGLIAGLNAGRKCRGKSQIVFSPNQCYLGVMTEDLCGTVIHEPYRMFTSRAEARLFLRIDNAEMRMSAFMSSVEPVESEQEQRANSIIERLQEYQMSSKIERDTKKDREDLVKSFNLHSNTKRSCHKDWLSKRLNEFISAEALYKPLIDSQMRSSK